MIVPFHISELLTRLRERFDENAINRALMASKREVRRLRPARRASEQSARRFWERILADTDANKADSEMILDPQTVADLPAYDANIENMIGTVKVPVGIVGPLRVNGIHAQGDFLVPLATSEAALVASYGRGADVTAAAGGISAALTYDGVLRTPAFKFGSAAETGVFLNWVVQSAEALKAAAEATTRHGKLVSLEPAMDNEICFLRCRFMTGDASGQNMVTIATSAMCEYIVANAPVKPRAWYVEGNYSGDKKGSFLGLLTGRGAKVTASATIPADIVRRKLRCTVDEMLEYGRVANLGSLLSGQLGAQAHYANALAALFIATGQDAACVAESAVGFTRMEDCDGDLMVSVTLPNLLVGTVGGGTGLPSQSAGLRILGLRGSGKRPALAEVAAALCLCGEISIVAAMAAGDFVRAHERYARHR
ncbi:hydroxymethylglutaryl-CoA reductase [Hoeflea prorocentri]|uniref:hydroxymethylglutaryl-CoA reductase (NADPH) n=1 Tax=Hoeflea prorocentri TaxID=1922333 RepID=A0A9X3ULV7_9HYPH|nr:hydroxymethylglutaryl-CoA reductase [Hoeflea prorocentri]MCY6383004.1 hydroxymethylglutaryl-CoA reductase [Hoeflea prorocentri]MDA5400804.1 hydroxymethylglutaryl-CoA reductase [Hoeflea prorocentri]